jgi:hypothetical protein
MRGSLKLKFKEGPMRKFIIVLFAVFCLSALSFGSEAKSVKPDTAIRNISFTGVYDTNNLTLFADSNTASTSDDNVLTPYYKLFFGLTIAFGVAAFTFLVMGIVFTAVYGVSNNMIRTAATAENYNRWYDSQSGLLAGTVASWSLFAMFAICGTASGIILIIASNGGKNKLTKLELKPSFKEVSLQVCFQL